MHVLYETITRSARCSPSIAANLAVSIKRAGGVMVRAGVNMGATINKSPISRNCQKWTAVYYQLPSRDSRKFSTTGNAEPHFCILIRPQPYISLNTLSIPLRKQNNTQKTKACTPGTTYALNPTPYVLLFKPEILMSTLQSPNPILSGIYCKPPRP